MIDEFQSDTERTLAAIWTRELGAEVSSRRANFFELGGDSIAAVAIVTAAAEHGIELEPVAVFEAPTIAELAHVAGGAPVTLPPA